jgi:hypothetical protein
LAEIELESLPEPLGGLYVFQYKNWFGILDVQYGYTDAGKISAWLIDFSACGYRIRLAIERGNIRATVGWMDDLKRTMLLIHSVINNTTVLLILL